MHRFPVPNNIQLINPIDGKPADWVGWRRWFIECVLNDRRMGSKPVELARVVRLLGKVTEETAGPGRDLGFEDDDYGTLKPIVETPELAMGGPVMMAQLLPFSEAFLKAEKS